MSKISGYRCSICQTQYQLGEVTYNCTHDGGDMDVILDYEGLKDRYHPEDTTAGRIHLYYGNIPRCTPQAGHRYSRWTGWRRSSTYKTCSSRTKWWGLPLRATQAQRWRACPRWWDGSYDDAFDLTIKAAGEFSW